MGVENNIFEGTAGNPGSLASWELLRTWPSECFLIPSFIFPPLEDQEEKLPSRAWLGKSQLGGCPWKCH